MNVPSAALHAARSHVQMITNIDSPMFLVRREPGGTFRYVHANRAMAAIGFAADSIDGRRPEDILPLRVARNAAGKYDTCLRTGAPLIYEQELRLNGRHCWWHTALTPLLASGSPTGVILGVVTDISAAKEALIAATTRAVALERQYEDLKLLTSLTAHDLRAPMGNVRSLVDLVLDGFQDLGDDKAMMIARCGEVADQALVQIDVIMAHARALDASGPDLVALNLARVCEDIATLVDPVGAIHIDYPDDAIVAEQMVLQMTLRNLLDNAVRYCRGRIRIDLEADSLPNLLALTVSDDGPGIAATGGSIDGSHAARAGRGFGLKNVRALLQGRGGNLVHLDPADGFGTRLQFTVPGHRPMAAGLMSDRATG